MSVRSEIADLIRSKVPSGWVVKPYGFLPDRLPDPVVCVEQSTVKPRTGFSQRTTTVAVTVMVSGDTPEQREDNVETALDVLLLAMAPIYGAIGEANRVTIADKFPAYQVTVEVATTLDLETD